MTEIREINEYNNNHEIRSAYLGMFYLFASPMFRFKWSSSRNVIVNFLFYTSMFIYIMINAFITSLFTVLFLAVWSLRRMLSGSTRHTLDKVCIAFLSIFVSRCQWPSSFDHCPLLLKHMKLVYPTVFEPKTRHMLPPTSWRRNGVLPLKIWVASIGATIKVCFRSCSEFSDNCLTFILIGQIRVAFLDNLGSTVRYFHWSTRGTLFQIGQNCTSTNDVWNNLGSTVRYFHWSTRGTLFQIGQNCTSTNDVWNQPTLLLLKIQQRVRGVQARSLLSTCSRHQCMPLWIWHVS